MVCLPHCKIINIMADQNKDLPLVVSEILIEMYGMNNRLERVEKVLVDVVDSLKQLSSAVSRMFEVINLQQQENTKGFELLMEADRANTTMLINAFREEASVTRNRLDNIENRFEK